MNFLKLTYEIYISLAMKIYYLFSFSYPFLFHIKLSFTLTNILLIEATFFGIINKDKK